MKATEDKTYFIYLVIQCQVRDKDVSKYAQVLINLAFVMVVITVLPDLVTLISVSSELL